MVAGVGVGDVRTVKLKRPLAPASPFGWRTDHATLHVPAGIGSMIATVQRQAVGAELRAAGVRLGERIAVARDDDLVGVADRLRRT